MTIPEVADRINALFRDYGLDHDVVLAQPLMGAYTNEGGPPPLMITLRGSSDEATMSNLYLTLANVFDAHFEKHGKAGQMRLF